MLIYCNSSLKQLYLRNKTERFSYKGGCGIRKCMHIEMFKEELVWAIDERLQVISNKKLFKQLYHQETKE